MNAARQCRIVREVMVGLRELADPTNNTGSRARAKDERLLKKVDPNAMCAAGRRGGPKCSWT